MTFLLRKSLSQERELAVVGQSFHSMSRSRFKSDICSGLQVVDGFDNLTYYADALALFQSHPFDGSGPAAVRPHNVCGIFFTIELFLLRALVP